MTSRVSRFISSLWNVCFSGFPNPPARFGIPHPTPKMVTKTKNVDGFRGFSQFESDNEVGPTIQGNRNKYGEKVVIFICLELRFLYEKIIFSIQVFSSDRIYFWIVHFREVFIIWWFLDIPLWWKSRFLGFLKIFIIFDGFFLLRFLSGVRTHKNIRKI